MSDNPPQQSSDTLQHIYEKLNPQDVEQFYIGYQRWYTQQQIATLQTQIDTLQQQIAENAACMQLFHPPAVALATLARLQAKGVNDIDLLDRMLERGEEWLDLTMQRLDYCEQLHFIHDNYAQWCQHALEGAYDWIDSMRDTANAETLPLPVATSDADESSADATEELLLRKLTSEEEEIPLADTHKRPAVSLAPTTEETSPIAHSTVATPATVATPGDAPPGEQSEADTKPSLPLTPAEQASEPAYIEFVPTAETPSLTTAHAEADPLPVPLAEVSAAEPVGQAQELSFTEVQSVETDVEVGTSLVADEQAEYLEFAPPAEALPPVETDTEASPPPVADEQANEPQYLAEDLEIAPSAETPLLVEADTEVNASHVASDQVSELESTPPAEASLPVEAETMPAIETDSSLETQQADLPVASQQAGEPASVALTSSAQALFWDEADAETDPYLTAINLHSEPAPPAETPHPVEASIKADPAHVMQAESQEPEIPLPVTENDAQASILQEKEQSALEAKPQRRRGFWQWLLALFRR